MLFIDPTIFLDPKALTLSIMTLGLYITTTIAQFKLSDKMSRILRNQTRKNDDDNEIEKERIKAIGTLENMLKNIEDSERKLDIVLQHLQANAAALDTIVDDVGEINKQQTILATAQLNQTQSTARIIDGLMDALREHRE